MEYKGRIIRNNIPPIFIELHSVGVNGLINVWDINCITPYTDMITHVRVDYRDEPLCVDESYEEIKKKLEAAIWIV